jgi:hypothetical protein
MMIFASDPSVPNFWSSNPVCPAVGVPRSLGTLNLLHIYLVCMAAYWSVVQMIWPQRFWINLILGFCVGLYFNGFDISVTIGGCLFILGGFLVLYRYARRNANLVQEEAKNLYESAWAKALEEEGSKENLDAIASICKKMNEELKDSLARSISELHWWRQIIYRIGAGGFGRYSRSGKIRQATKKIDDLFIEVVDPNASESIG